MSGMASPPDVDMTSTGDGYPHYSTCPRIDCHTLGSHTHGTASSLPDAIEQIREERDRLREQLTTHLRTSDYLRAQMEPCEMHDGARRACGQCLSSREAELVEIKRVLIAFHRQEGDGIVSVKRLAKRLHEASAPQADLSGGAVFSGPPEPSYGGTDE